MMDMLFGQYLNINLSAPAQLDSIPVNSAGLDTLARHAARHNSALLFTFRWGHLGLLPLLNIVKYDRYLKVHLSISIFTKIVFPI